MADNKSDYEKKGFLWHENESTVERKGNFTLKGKKLYGGIIKSFNDKGEAKYELFQSIGLLHPNTQKKSDRSPDMFGKITVNKDVYKVGCWAKESERGTPYTSLGFEEFTEEEQKNSDNPPF